MHIRPSYSASDLRGIKANASSSSASLWHYILLTTLLECALPLALGHPLPPPQPNAAQRPSLHLFSLPATVSIMTSQHHLHPPDLISGPPHLTFNPPISSISIHMYPCVPMALQIHNNSKFIMIHNELLKSVLLCSWSFFFFPFLARSRLQQPTLDLGGLLLAEVQ